MKETEFKKHTKEALTEISRVYEEFNKRHAGIHRAVGGIMGELDAVREAPLCYTKWGEFLNNIGARALFLLEKVHGEDCESEEWKMSFIDLLWEKHKRYGYAPLVRWGNLGIAIRIDSKVQRYFNMMGNCLDPNGETEIDTLKDIVGYTILLSFNQRGLFPADGSSK